MGLNINKKKIRKDIEYRSGLFQKDEDMNKTGSRETEVLDEIKKEYEKCSFFRASFVNKGRQLKVYRDLIFQQCQFNDCYFEDIVFQNCTFIACDFISCEFSEVSFRRCLFWDNDIPQKEFTIITRLDHSQDSFRFEKTCYFFSSRFVNTSFIDCDLSFVLFKQVFFNIVKFFESIMIKSLLNKCDFSRCISQNTTHAGSKFFEIKKFDILFVDHSKDIFDRNTIFHCANLDEPNLKTFVERVRTLSRVGIKAHMKAKYSIVKDAITTQKSVYYELHRLRYSTYSQISDIFQEIGYSSLSGEYFYLGKKEEIKSLSSIDRIPHCFISALCGYGERPSHTFICIILNILVFGLFYLFSGVAIDDKLISISAVKSAWPHSIIEFFKLYCHSAFFSITTFSTVGYGNYVPVGAISSTLAAIQMLMGVSLTALWTGCIFRKISR